MTTEIYIPKNFRDDAVIMIDKANKIIAEYQLRGFKLTLRQLYYQFVARKFFENTYKNYQLLSRTMVNARDAGMSDWDAVEDRTREVSSPAWWSSPQSFLKDAVKSYAEDLWDDQDYYPEVWVEKDALVGVIGLACSQRRVTHCSTRGNFGQLPMRDAGLRFAEKIDEGKTPVVLHLADHDPTGVEMTNDVTKRLELYAGEEIEVRRIALTIKQVRHYNPPPNPVKESDANTAKYKAEFGTEECWELDALNPDVIVNLIRNEIEGLIDEKAWKAAERKERRHHKFLQDMVEE
jgi:hypothetical protein